MKSCNGKTAARNLTWSQRRRKNFCFYAGINLYLKCLICVYQLPAYIFFQVKFAQIKLTHVHNTLSLLYLFNFAERRDSFLHTRWFNRQRLQVQRNQKDSAEISQTQNEIQVRIQVISLAMKQNFFD